MTSFFDSNFARRTYNEEQYKITAKTLAQIDKICYVIEERNSLRTKLKESQAEFEVLKKIKQSRDITPSSSETKSCTPLGVTYAASCEEIQALEDEIETLRNSRQTPQIQVEIMRKEVEVLKKYCSRMAGVQRENQKLHCDVKNMAVQLEASKKLLCEIGVGDVFNQRQVEVLREKWASLDALTREKDRYSCMCQERDCLKEKLDKVEQLEGDCESILHQLNLERESKIAMEKTASFLEEVVQDRDRLKCQVEQLQKVEKECESLRKKVEFGLENQTKVDLMAKQLDVYDSRVKALNEALRNTSDQLASYKTESCALRGQLKLVEQENQCLKMEYKKADVLKYENDRLTQTVNDMTYHCMNYDDLCQKIKCLEVEKNVYKDKVRQLSKIECEYNEMKTKLEIANEIEQERDYLSQHVRELQSTITIQECEIKKLVCHIDNFSKTQEAKENELIESLCALKAQLDKKDKKLAITQAKLCEATAKLEKLYKNASFSEENENELAGLKEEFELVENELETIREKYFALQNELEATREKCSNLEREKSDNILKREVEQTKNVCKELQRENNMLHEKLNESTAAIDDYEAMIDILRNCLKERDTVIDSLDKEFQLTKDLYEKSQLYIKSLREEKVIDSPGKNKDIEYAESLQDCKVAIERISDSLQQSYQRWSCVKQTLDDNQRPPPKMFNRKPKPGCNCDNMDISDSNSSSGSGSAQECRCCREPNNCKRDKDYLCVCCECGEQLTDSESSESSSETTFSSRSDKGCLCTRQDFPQDDEPQYKTIDDKGGNNDETLSKDSPVKAGSQHLAATLIAAQPEREVYISEESPKLDPEKKLRRPSEDRMKLVSRQKSLTKEPEVSPKVDAEKKLKNPSEDRTKLVSKGKSPMEEPEESRKLEAGKQLRTSSQDKTKLVSKQKSSMEEPEERRQFHARGDDMKEPASNDRQKKSEECAEEKLKIENLLKENELLRSKLKNAECVGDENIALRKYSEELKHSATDILKDMEKNLIEAKYRIAELEKIIESQKIENTSLKTEIETLKKQLEDLRRKYSELPSGITKDSLRKEQQDTFVLQAMITDLENKLKNANKIPKIQPADDFQAVMDSLVKKLEEEQRRADSAEAAYKNIQRRDLSIILKNEIEELKKQLNNCISEKKNLEGDILRLENLNNEFKEKLKIEQRSREPNAIFEDNENLREQLKKALKEKEEIKNLKQFSKQSFEKLRALQDENGKLKKDNIHLQNDTIVVKKELKNVRDGQKRSDMNVGQLERENEKCKDKIKALENNIAHLKREMDSILDQSKRTAQDNSELQKENSTLKETICQLESQLAKLKKKLENTVSQIEKSDDLERKLAEVTRDLLQKEEQEEEKKAKLYAFQFQLADLEKDNAKDKQRIEALERELQNVRKELEEYVEKYKKNTDELNLLKIEDANLKQRVTTLESDNVKLNGNLDKMVLEKKHLLKLVESTVATDEMEKLKKNLEDLRRELDMYKGQTKELKDNDAKLRKEMANREALIAKLQTDLDKAVQETKKKTEEFAKREEKFNEEKQKLQKALIEAAGDSEMTDKLRDEIANKELENTKLKIDLDKFVEELKKVKKEVKSTTVTTQKNEIDLQQLKQKLVDLEKEKANLQKYLTSAVADNKKMAEKVEAAKGGDAQMQRKLAQIEAENMRLKKESEAAIKKADEGRTLSDDNDKQRKKISELEAELSKAKKQTEAALETAKQALKSETGTQDDGVNLKKKNLELESQTKKLKNDLDSALKDLKSITQALELMQHENKQLKHIITQLENEQSELKKKYEIAKAVYQNKIKESEKQLRSTKAELEKGRTDKGNLFGENKAANIKIDELTKQLEKLKNELEKAKDNISQLEDEVKKDAGPSGKANITDEDVQRQQRLAQKEMENVNLKQEIDALKKKITVLNNDGDKLKAELETTNKKVVENKQLNAKLKKESFKDLQNLVNMSDMREENKHLKQALADHEKSNKRLSKDLEAIGPQLQDAKEASKEIQKLKDALSKSDKSKGDYENKIKNLTDELAKYKKECTDTINDLKDQFERDAQNLKNENSEIISKLQQKQEDICKDLVDKYEKEIKQLQDEIKRMQIAFQAKEQEKQKNFKTLLDYHKRQSDDFIRQVEEVEKVMEEERSKNRDLLQIVLEQRRKSKELQETLSQKKKEKCDIELKAKSEERKNNLLKDKYIQERSKSILLGKENLAQLKQIKELEESVEQERRKSQTLELDNKLLQAEHRLEDNKLGIKKPKVESRTSQTPKLKGLPESGDRPLPAVPVPDVIAITIPSNSGVDLRSTCTCPSNLFNILKKISKNGMQGLKMEELQVLQKRIEESMAKLLGVSATETDIISALDKLTLMHRISSLEQQIRNKELETKTKVDNLQIAIMLERNKLLKLKETVTKLKTESLIKIRQKPLTECSETCGLSLKHYCETCRKVLFESKPKHDKSQTQKSRICGPDCKKPTLEGSASKILSPDKSETSDKNKRMNLLRSLLDDQSQGRLSELKGFRSTRSDTFEPKHGRSASARLSSRHLKKRL